MKKDILLNIQQKRKHSTQSTVTRNKQRKDKVGTFNNQLKTRRLRLIIGRIERSVVRLITTGKYTNAVEIQKKLKLKIKLKVP